MKIIRVVYFGLFKIGIALLLGAASGYADTIYLDSPSWNAAVAGKPVAAVTIPDPAPNRYIFFGAGTASVTYSSVDFSTGTALGSDELFNIGVLLDGTPAVVTEQRAGASGEGNLLITFPEAVVAFSLDFGTYDGYGVNFLLSNGDNFLEPNFGTGNYSTPNFVGVTDTPFTSILLTSVDADLSVNNVSYVASTPEPAPVALISCGLLGFAWWRRHKRNPSVSTPESTNYHSDKSDPHFPA